MPQFPPLQEVTLDDILPAVKGSPASVQFDHNQDLQEGQTEALHYTDLVDAPHWGESVLMGEGPRASKP